MSKVAEISKYRASRRNEFLAQYGQKLESLIRSHLRQNFPLDIRQLQSMYCRYQAANSQTHWEIMDLREILHNYVSSNIIQDIMPKLRRLHWFDTSVWTIEELTERCVSILILEDNVALTS